MVPTVMSMALLSPDSARLRPAVATLDAAVFVLAAIDLLTLGRSGRLRAVRSCGAVASLGEVQEVELTVENPGRSRRRVRVRDDVPDTFEAEPADFLVSVPGRGLAVLTYKLTPRRRGSYRFRRAYAVVSSAFGLWQRQVKLEGRHGRAGVSRRPPDRPLYPARPPRQAQRPGGPAVATPRHRQRIRAPARLLRGGRAAPHGLAGHRQAPQADGPGASGQSEPAGHLPDRLRPDDGRRHRRRALAAGPRLQRHADAGTRRAHPGRPGRHARLLGSRPRLRPPVRGSQADQPAWSTPSTTSSRNSSSRGTIAPSSSWTAAAASVRSSW